jgi:hypothetical protein
MEAILSICVAEGRVFVAGGARVLQSIRGKPVREGFVLFMSF